MIDFPISDVLDVSRCMMCGSLATFTPTGWSARTAGVHISACSGNRSTSQPTAAVTVMATTHC
jgi:hypothetical protein